MTSPSLKKKQELKRIDSLLKGYDLCDHCIGRLCTHRKDDETFQKAGQRIRNEITNLSETACDQCYLCNGLFSELSDFYLLAKESITNYDFKSFLIGCQIDEEIVEREKQLIEEFHLINTASLKQEINEYIGILLETEIHKEVDFKHPDIMIIVDTRYNIISLQIKSLFFYGRYNKFQRGIPQTKWFCRKCRGKGCRYCHYTGKLYDASIEEFIAYPILKATVAKDESFHGAGREDIDVRMLGNGRPFVLEVKDPKKRTIDFQQIKKQIETFSKGAITIQSLKSTNSSDIARIKQAHFRKVYEVRIHAKNPIQKEKLKKVALSLHGKTINQQTPTRVAKRRADLIRRRQIYHCKVMEVNGTRASLQIETESGTYIKELITGDDGRTQPNLSEMLNDSCIVETLDVIEVKGE
jgi:tRNA pseudouridine synthase 10